MTASRREFLAVALAQAAAPPAQPQLIDVHHHIVPPVYLAEARSRLLESAQAGLPAGVLQWTPGRAIAEMDQNGVATAIVSISTPGVWFGDVLAGRTLARKCNEYSAQLARDYPGRFGFFASIPLPDIEGSLREIAYAFDTLHADGVCLMTSYGDKWPGDASYRDVFAELDRRHAVAYFHPSIANCCRNLMSYLPFQVLELAHEDTRAIVSLLFSGAFGRYRNIRFIFSHAGGDLPMAAARVVRQASARPEVTAGLPEGVEAALKRLYYEIAGSSSRPALAALTAFAPPGQILFGSDYPWLRIGTTAADVSHEMRASMRANALRLLQKNR
jgi:predicted TIM-barrel fold metal-dependent hydrolase